MADEGAIQDAFEEFHALNTSAHLLCPKVDDDDEENYDDLDDPGEVGLAIKKQRVDEANDRLDLTYRASQCLGFPEEEVQEALREWKDRTSEALRLCAGCVRHWHQHRRRFLRQLSEIYNESVSAEMGEKLHAVDSKRIASGLKSATTFISERHGLVEQKTFIDAGCAELLVALYEALCCISFLSEPENRVDFNLVFEKVQEKKPLRLGDVLPTMTHFLFDEDKVRYTFAKTSWTKMRRMSAEDFEWAVKPSLEAAVNKTASSHDSAQMQRFWEGFAMILRAVPSDLIGPCFGSLEISPNIYQTMLQHLNNTTSEATLAIIMKVFCTILTRKPSAFWVNFENFAPMGIAESVFTSQAFRRLLKQTLQFSISMPEDEFMKGPVAIAWVKPFIDSIPASAKDTASDAIMRHLLDEFGQDSSMSFEGRAACFRGAVEALLSTLIAYNKHTFRIHAGSTTIHTNRVLKLTLKHKETLIMLVKDRHHEDIPKAAVAIIGNALLLDSRVTAEEFSMYNADKPVQHDEVRDSMQLWEAFLELLTPGATSIAKVMLLATSPLVPVEVLRAPKKESLSKEKEHFNAEFLKTVSVIGRMLERLAEFKPADLNQLCEDPQTIRPIVAALINGESDINAAAVSLVKTVTDEERRSDAMLSFVERYFSPVLVSFKDALEQVLQDKKLWSAQQQMLLCSKDILAALTDPGLGVLRSKILENAERGYVLAWWETQWTFIENAFKGLDGWSKYVSTDTMKDFFRDVMELANSLLTQDGLLSSALSTSSEAKAGSSRSTLIELLQSPRSNSMGMVQMLRLKDPWLIEVAVKNLVRLLTRLSENGLEPTSDVADFVRRVCTKNSQGKFQIATNLKNSQRAELLRALGGEDDGSDIEIVGVQKVEGLKRQSKLDAWSKAGDASSVKSTALPLTSSKDEDFDDLTPTLAKKSSALDHIRSRQAAAVKPSVLKTQSLKSEVKPPADANRFKEERRKAQEAKKRRDAEAAAKLKGFRPSNAKTVPGEGSGLQGLTGVHGKEHTATRSELFTDGSDSDDDSDDDRAFRAQTKAGVARMDDSSKRIVGLKQQVQPRGPVKITKQQRTAKDMRARIIPPMDVLHQAILDWDIFHESNDPPNGTQCSHVSDAYTDHSQYKQTFLPLLIYEAWRSFVTDKNESTATPFGVKVQNRMTVDKFIEVTASTSKAEAKDRWLSEGDLVLLSTSAHPLDDREATHCLARVWRNTFKSGNMETSYRLSGIKNPLLPLLVKDAELYAVKITNMTTIEREYAALESLQYYDLFQQIMEAKPSPMLKFSDERVQRYVSNYFLNVGQAKAVINAQENDGFTLVQGPPGTGKTKTIIAMVGALMTGHFPAVPGKATTVRPTGAISSKSSQATQKKLLVCAPSNAAVDELVLRLKAGVKSHEGKFHKINVLRLGRTDAINAAVKDVSLDELVKTRYEGEKKENGIGVTDRQKMHEEAGTIKREMSDLRPQLEMARSSDNRSQVAELQRKFDDLKRRQIQIGTKIDADKEGGHAAARENEILKRKIQQEILDSAQVLCTTLSGSGHEMFKNLNVEFDTVIIDEAAQCVELSALIPLKYGCTKCILVGDPKQLPPTVLSQSAAKYGYDQSLFVRMQRNQPDDIHLLDQQYRMHPEISLFPSQEFYEGRLIDGADMAKQRQQPWHQTELLGPYRFFDVEGLQERGQKGQSYINMQELKVAMQLYDRFRLDNPRLDLKGKIGIITPYKAQLFRLRDEFARRYGEVILSEIEFNTTDAFQGRECEIIIFSCVRANPANGIGFMTDIRRMNVGLTRAKSSLWVLGNSKALVQGPYWKKLIMNAKERDRYTSGDIISMLQKAGAKLPSGFYNKPVSSPASSRASTPVSTSRANTPMRDAPNQPEKDTTPVTDVHMADPTPISHSSFNQRRPSATQPRPLSSHRHKTPQLPQTYTVLEKNVPPAETFSNRPAGYSGLNDRGETVSEPNTANRPVIHSASSTAVGQKRQHDGASPTEGGPPKKKASAPLLPGRPRPIRPPTIGRPPASSMSNNNTPTGPGTSLNAPKGPGMAKKPRPPAGLLPPKRPADPFIRRKPPP